MLEALEEEDELLSPAWLKNIGFIEIPYKTVQSVMHEFTEKAVNVIFDTLQNAGIKKDSITHVLYAGGVCKSEDVKRHIREKFPYSQEILSKNPQSLTGVGNARLAQYGYNIRLATNFGARQCDGQCCILLEKGQKVSADRYRQAEFIVTNTRAAEALFDLGIQSKKDGWSMLEVKSDRFRSMKQLFLTVGGENNVQKPVADRIIMFVSLADDLTITVYIQAKMSNAWKETSISGIPLLIDVGEGML